MKKGFNRKKKSLIEYPDIPSVIRPVPHSDQLLTPEQCKIDQLCSDDAESSEESSISDPCTSRNKKFGITSQPHSINESGLNDLVSDLDFPKFKADLLASRLKQWNFFQSGVNVCSFRKRQQSLALFFSMKGELVRVILHSVNGIMQELGNSYKPKK